MEPNISLLHVVEPKKLKPQNSINVRLSVQFNRRNPSALTLREIPTGLAVATSTCQSSDPNSLHSAIDKIWQQRTLENPKLYNGTKFRVHSISASKEDHEKVLMCLGVTDYKEYLGTNWADNVTELQTQGHLLHENPQAFLSDALGVGAFVLTDDWFVVFLRRSEFCAEANCQWDIPGGHAEPKEIVGEIPLDQIKLSDMMEEQVTEEIFQSIIREVTDEVNIAPTHLDDPLYMGTVRNKTSGGRPSSEFLIRCHLTSQEVERLYEKGSQSEADESTNIKLVPLHEVNQLVKEDVRQSSDFWKNLAPSAKGCLILYWLSHQIA